MSVLNDRHGAPKMVMRTRDEAGFEALKESQATETRRMRRIDRRLDPTGVSSELASVIRGRPLDPRQAGVLHEEDILRSPSPHPPDPEPGPLQETEQKPLPDMAKMARLLATPLIREDRKDRFTLDPDSGHCRNLYWMVFVCSLYTVFAEPYLLVLEHYSADWKHNAPGFFIFLSGAIEIFFLFDLVAGPFKGYHKNEIGAAGWKTELKLERTSLNYLQTWFVVDLLSRMCPVQLAVFGMNHKFRSIDALFVFSVLKLLMIMRVYDGFSSLVSRDLSLYRRVGIAKALLMGTTTVHWLACAWLIVLAQSSMASEHAAETAAGSFNNSCFDRSALVLNNSREGQYLCSYYITMQSLTTTAYGDISATGFADRAFFIVVMVLGISLVYLSFVASFGSASSSDELVFIHERNRLVDFMQTRSLPADILEDTKAFYQHRWNLSKGYIDLNQLKKLPPFVSVPAFHHLYSGIRHHVNFLMRPKEDIFFWNFLIERMEYEAYMPGDTIRRADDPSHFDSIFIILHGIVEEIHVDTGYVFRRHSGPSWFGEVEEISGRKRVAAIRAAAVCDLFVLNLSAIRSLFSMPTFKDFKLKLTKCCQERIYSPGVARWKHYLDKHKKNIHKLVENMVQPPPPWPKRPMLDGDKTICSTPKRSSTAGSERTRHVHSLFNSMYSPIQSMQGTPDLQHPSANRKGGNARSEDLYRQNWRDKAGVGEAAEGGGASVPLDTADSYHHDIIDLPNVPQTLSSSAKAKKSRPPVLDRVPGLPLAAQKSKSDPSALDAGWG